MATLHMDVESVNGVVNTINSAKETIAQQIQTLNGNVDGMVGSTWIAPSANQFQSTYKEWASMMNNMVEQLETLNNRLKAEIADFEQAASTLA